MHTLCTSIFTENNTKIKEYGYKKDFNKIFIPHHGDSSDTLYIIRQNL